jgi:mannose-6-phosphate isomerase-like protein (cupin superfamily)
MSYEANIVKKPWGHEYLAYENEDVGLWFLYIAPGQSTSMHCHPKKTTGLVLLDGNAEISFLADKRELKPLDKVMIRRGLFHSTKATSEKGAFVFEIETPKDKHDLVRLNDQYGRASKPYEDSTFESTKNDKCLWISEPKLGEFKLYRFADCWLKIETIDSINVINEKNGLILENSGICDLVENGEIVSKWEEPNHHSAIEKLDWAYNNRSKIKLLAKQGAKILSEYTWERMAKSLLDFI